MFARGIGSETFPIMLKAKCLVVAACSNTSVFTSNQWAMKRRTSYTHVQQLCFPYGVSFAISGKFPFFMDLW
ncbi:hypothetical protein POVWA2_005280 [Plasmodium ovale wallikeri]|uniref:Uncharacterized protein n=1 Tax=Plasmodium ovale wallikeri TaxID=864142 RepID=A0A1A8YHN8_PLAOA|nr:hypothetical protein POVWA1_005200 [Plasmodium ovale wallikeri]SBT31661.1 hypothetical protein POVWA2_005280 [Plasmodium ovale wallikeri]